MTIAQSLESISFRRHGSKLSAMEPAQRTAEPPVYALPNGITCSPWEGLYFPVEELASSNQSAGTNPHVERFPMNLMSGE